MDLTRKIGDLGTSISAGGLCFYVILGDSAEASMAMNYYTSLEWSSYNCTIEFDNRSKYFYHCKIIAHA